MWRIAMRWFTILLVMGVVGCGYKGVTEANKNKDRPRTTAEKEQ